MKIIEEIKIENMHCAMCESTIENAVNTLEGIFLVKADYISGTVNISYDNEKTNIQKIYNVIEEKGYSISSENKPKKNNYTNLIISIISLLVIVIIIFGIRKYGNQIKLPQVDSETGIGMIFILGLLTGLHCIGMCGSFIIGYTSKDIEQKRKPFKSHLFYSFGKIISYSLIGAAFGLLGSVFKITPLISGISITIAGAFLILYGLNVLNVFHLIKIKLFKESKSIKTLFPKFDKLNAPFFIGLYSGFIIGCGPLQAMYILAIGVGEAFFGFKLLLIFALGTLPALIAFGFITSLLSKKINSVVLKASGIILIVIGLMMFNKGFEKMNKPIKINTPKQNMSFIIRQNYLFFQK